MSVSEVVYDVIIIGCGTAGIAAGIELQKHQSTTNFLLIEARNRVGGRALTDTHTFDGNIPVDLAARIIHRFHPDNPFYAYYNLSNKDLFDYVSLKHDTTAFFYSDGTPVPSGLVIQAEKIADELDAILKSYPSDAGDKSIYDVIRTKYENIQDEQMRRLVDIILARIEYHEVSELDEISAKSHLKPESRMKICDLVFPDGLGSFMEQIVERHRLPVQLNTIVTHVDLGASKNELVRIFDQDGRHYLTKYVLIAVPLGCLKARSIKFTPALPDWKQSAIDRMGLGMLNKVIIQFPSTFWDEKLDHILIASDRFRFFACYPRGHILALLVTGKLAYELEQQTDEKTIEQILQTLREVYPQMPKPTKWIVTRFGSDPLAYGAYSNFKVGTTYETCEELARDCYDGRVHWGGEYANYGGAIGCFDSAVESGCHQAKLIHEKLNQLPK